MTSRSALIVGWVLLACCADSRPEPDCETCDPPDLGMRCEMSARSSMGVAPGAIETSSPWCMGRSCVFDTDDEPRPLNSRELCLEEGNVPAEVCNDGTFYSMDEFVDRLYCSCQCGVVDCPCDSPGFECRMVAPSRELYCMRVLD